ncbi:MAG: DUF475 domain-containing protein [Myxococcota bacterium]
MLQSIVVIAGLTIFEIISSIDNAIVNAHVLKTVPERYRRFFLVWGLLLAVFVMRGVLPFTIVWLANMNLSFTEAAHMAFSDPATMEASLEESRPILLLGGGVYLFFVFLSWLFLEEKKYAFFLEQFIHRQGLWFYSIAAIFLLVVTYYAVRTNPWMAVSAQVGSSAFFITEGFRKNAEQSEEQLHGSNLSAWSKLLYLEVLDASFSIDGVIGAFAFTMSVPLILAGNGIGALVVREVTVRGIDLVSKFAYLKNGAMYSIGMLGLIMVVEAFGHEYPFWLAPVNTVVLLVVFLWLSYREIKAANRAASWRRDQPSGDIGSPRSKLRRMHRSIAGPASPHPRSAGIRLACSLNTSENALARVLRLLQTRPGIRWRGCLVASLISAAPRAARAHQRQHAPEHHRERAHPQGGDEQRRRRRGLARIGRLGAGLGGIHRP